MFSLQLDVSEHSQIRQITSKESMAKREGETSGLQDDGKKQKLTTEEETRDTVNQSMTKKQVQKSGPKNAVKKRKSAPKRVPVHELIERGLKNIKETISYEKTKDRLAWDQHVDSLMKTIAVEKEKDRKFWMNQTAEGKNNMGDGQNNMDTKDEASLYYGESDTMVSEGGEADLKKHFDDCQRNPGHTKFVPVNDFNISHLPESYRDDVIVELIKATAALTVRVDVKMTSDKRPSVWPNTDKPFAFSNIPKSTVTRVGTGTVYFVKIFHENYNAALKKGTCTCRKCVGPLAETPSKSWGLVKMITETELVFDALEAQHTSSKFFYDAVESSPTELDGWKVQKKKHEQGLRGLTCVTCDMDLLNRLQQLIKVWRPQWDKVNDKYKSATAEDKLIFIVSHPHGIFKHVSVGTLMNSYKSGDGWTKYLYNTDTCEGSCGAYVQVIGYNSTWEPLCFHVHSGVNSNGKNFSCVGVEAN